MSSHCTLFVTTNRPFRQRATGIILLLSLTFALETVAAGSGGEGLTIEAWAVNSGTMQSTGTPYMLDGVVGQSVVSEPSRGSRYSLTAGPTTPSPSTDRLFQNSFE